MTNLSIVDPALFNSNSVAMAQQAMNGPLMTSPSTRGLLSTMGNAGPVATFSIGSSGFNTPAPVFHSKSGSIPNFQVNIGYHYFYIRDNMFSPLNRI